MRPSYFFWIAFGLGIFFMGILYRPFLFDMLVAMLLCVSSFFIKNFLDKYLRFSWLSSLVCVLIFVVAFALPIYFVLNQSIKFIFHIDKASFDVFVESIKFAIINFLADFPTIAQEIKPLMSGISGSSILSYIVGFATLTTKWSVSLVSDLGLILVFLYFSFYYLGHIKTYILNIIPLDKDQTLSIFAEVSGVLRVVFFTSIVNIFLQGICFGVMIYFFGYDGFFIGVLYGAASIIPIVGGALIWLPLCIYEFWLGNNFGAIFIALYGMVFVGFVIDNIVKPYIIVFINKHLLKTSLKVREIFIFFSIVAGVSVFGFSGVIIGPAITAFFIALLRIYEQTINAKDSNIRI